MNPAALPRHALLLWLGVLAAAGGGLIAARAPAWPVVLVWAPALCLAELFWIPTFGRRATLSTAMVAHLAAAALLPAGQALALIAATALAADLAVQRKPAVKALYNAALSVLAAGAAGLVFAGLHAAGGAGKPVAPLVALLAAAPVYWAVNRAGVTSIVCLAGGLPASRVWRDNFGFGYEFLVTAVETLLAGCLIVIWPAAGPLGLVAFALPCFFINDSYRRRNQLEELRARLREERRAA